MTSPLANSSDRTTDDDLLCPSCGYNLRGATGDRCTECGTAYDRDTLLRLQLPWTHRRHIGSVRAYLKTVWMVIRQPTRVGREAAKPQSWADAVRFRRVTTVVVFVSLLVMAGLCINWVMAEVGTAPIFGSSSPVMPQLPDSMFWVDFAFQMAVAWQMWYVAPLYLLPLSIAWTGLASYWFHPRSLTVEQQNRAVALSCYTAAPLVGLMLLAALSLVLGALTGWADQQAAMGTEASMAAEAVRLLLVVVATLVIGGWWISTLKILKATTHASGARIATAAVCLPVLWLLAALASLWLLPSLVGFFVLLFNSLR